MKNLLRNTIALLLLGAAFLLFQNQLKSFYFSIRDKFFPCEFPIKYSIDDFDNRFGLSREEFLNSIEKAENIWEKAVHKNLFSYDPKGILKINLIYDDRQEITEKLTDLDFKIQSDKDYYDNLISRYENLKKDYSLEKTELQTDIVSFQNRQTEYEKSVTFWNNRGGASKQEFNRLNQELILLNEEVVELNQRQSVLNEKAKEINNLVDELNAFAKKINGKTENYNDLGRELGDEFEEGVYVENGLEKAINIYQFKDENNLVRILVHELGHALSLEHSENPSAIMYRLNAGENLELSKNDILMLKEHCKIDVSSAGIEPAITP